MDTETNPPPPSSEAHPPRHRRRNAEPAFSVHVKNIPLEVDEAEIQEKFSAFGQVTDVYMPKDIKTRRRKGFGFVEFDTLENAEKAVVGMMSFQMREGVDHPLFCELAKHGRKTKSEMMHSDHRGGGRYQPQRQRSPARRYQPPPPLPQQHSRRRRRSESPSSRRRESSPPRRRGDSPPRRREEVEHRDRRRRSPPPPSRRRSSRH